jgi:hypothetical protein
MTPDVQAFFDEATNTISYVVRDPQGRSAAIIDSVLDFDYASGRTDTRSADAIVDHVRSAGLDTVWILETHVHADHLSAAPYLQEKLGGRIGIGENITVVQDTFGKVFNEGTEFQRDGSQFDRLFRDGDSFHVGQLRGDVLHTPGPHARLPDLRHRRRGLRGRHALHAGLRHGALRLSRRVGRDDVRQRAAHPRPARRHAHLRGPRLQGAGAGRVRLGDDGGRAEGEERACGRRPVQGGVRGDARARDATLGMPKLIIPSLQVNMRAGQMPPADAQGDVFLKVPVNKL